MAFCLLWGFVKFFSGWRNGKKLLGFGWLVRGSVPPLVLCRRCEDVVSLRSQSQRCNNVVNVTSYYTMSCMPKKANPHLKIKFAVKF